MIRSLVFAIASIPKEKAMVSGKLLKRVGNFSAIEAIAAASQAGRQVFAFEVTAIAEVI